MKAQSIGLVIEAVREKLYNLFPRKEGQDEDGSSQINVFGVQTTMSKGEFFLFLKASTSSAVEFSILYGIGFRPYYGCLSLTSPR